jgi:outer membrane protein assembly factor BamB
MKPCFWTTLTLPATLSFTLSAADWPQYRGLHHDGSSAEELRTDWSRTAPKVVWKRSIQPAWSSITVAGARVFTQVNRRIAGQQREVCVALHADTGAELWAANLDTASYPNAGTGSTDGPRSTPTVDGDRVYVLTSYLKLYCLRADSGAVVWQRDFVAEFPGTEVISWQSAGSPLVVGDLIYLNSNVANSRLTAVRKSDGVTVWSGQDDMMTHATPAYATIGGTPQVVFLTARGTVGVTPDSGAVLWRHGFTPSATSTAASPVVAKDIVYASCAYSLGAWTAKVTRNGSAFSVGQTDFKRNNSYQNHWATPVHHDGYLYSVVERSARSLACFSLAGRTNTWISNTVGSGNPGYASLIKVGGKLLVLTESGELVLLEPNSAAYSEIARYRALGGTSWNHPAFANGRIYARSNVEILALDVAAAVVPLPALKLEAELLPDLGRLRLRVTAVNGTALTAAAAGQVQLQLAAPPAVAVPTWQNVTASFGVAAGALEAELPVPADSTFLRVVERTSP